MEPNELDAHEPAAHPAPDSAIDMSSPKITQTARMDTDFALGAPHRQDSNIRDLDDTLSSLRLVLEQVQKASAHQNTLANRTEAWMESIYEPPVFCPDLIETPDYDHQWTPLASRRVLQINSSPPTELTLPSWRNSLSMHRIVPAAPFSIKLDRLTRPYI